MSGVVESSERSFAAVETKSKLIEVALKIFGIDAMMGAIQPSFQVSERTVNMKGMRVGGMKHMFVAFQRGFGIAPPSIGVNVAAGLHALLQKVANRDGIGSLGQQIGRASGRGKG